MDLSMENRLDWTICRVAGEIDIFSAHTLREHLLAALDRPGSRLLLDLSQVTLMDTSGVAVLISTLRRAAQRGGTLRLLAPSPAVCMVLRATGLLAKFTVSSDLTGARTAEPLPGMRLMAS
jgi:anti-sigma B factor antagonist